MYKEIIFKKVGLKPLMCVAIVSFQLLVFSSFAQNPGGTAGSLTWEINLSDSTLTIRGNDTMPDYDPYFYPPWYSDRYKVSTIVIEDGVKSIGGFTFQKFNYVKSVTIPNSVTRIGYNSFTACISLASVTIPDPVTKIGVMAFASCRNLVYVNIPNSLTTIEEDAFNNCASLVSVTIPDAVTTIGKSAFVNCTNLKFVSIGNSVATIGGGAFSGCSNLDTVICHASTPPTIESYGAFWNLSADVFVPCGSIAAYQSANDWNRFTNYQAIGGNPLPAMPDNVAVVQQDNALEISWQSTGASSYEIYRNNALLTSVTTTTYNDTDITNGNYCYRINAVYNPCVSGLTPEVCDTVSGVGIKQLKIENGELKIYPNPTSGKLQVTNYKLEENSVVKIYDVVGQCVFTTPNPSKGGESSTSAQFPSFGGAGVVIDVSHLASGMYFLKVDNRVVKIIKN